MQFIARITLRRNAIIRSAGKLTAAHYTPATHCSIASFTNDRVQLYNNINKAKSININRNKIITNNRKEICTFCNNSIAFNSSDNLVAHKQFYSTIPTKNDNQTNNTPALGTDKAQVKSSANGNNNNSSNNGSQEKQVVEKEYSAIYIMKSLLRLILPSTSSTINTSTTTTSTNSTASKDKTSKTDATNASSPMISEEDDVFRKMLRTRIAVALSLLAGAKIANIQVPFLMKEIVDSLNVSEIVVVPVGLLFAYGAARAGASLFNELRNAVFATVSQSTIRKVSRKTFLHLHELDLSFHLSRETGALSRAIDRGSRGITTVLNAMVLHIFPTILEISLVCAILTYKCGPQFAGVTLATLLAYAGYTLSITQWRTKFRQQMNKMDNEAASIAMDSVINYETVKYFNNEQLEADRYEKYLSEYQKAALKVQKSLALLNFGQGFIFTSAVTAVMFMAAAGIEQGTMTIGDLVLVNGLLFQLALPLNFLGSVYRDLRQALTDMENMFKLLSQNTTITDTPNATNLCITKGDIEFKDVCFGYQTPICKTVKKKLLQKQTNASVIDSNDAASNATVTTNGHTHAPDEQCPNAVLQNLSFKIKGGTTTAFVGLSGSGKSTIMRFYDPQEGSIEIDGHNVKDVTLNSLRKNIGIIPQDCVLFNDTIHYNIKYGNPKAKDEEVREVARLAQIEPAILRMSSGYDTKVGERGLKLSGGEKQRVAIARAMLKNAPILLCDEATSALDSHTETGVLQSLNVLSKNRTTLFIAHRLSSIVDADEIIVLGRGNIVERGTHTELLARNGEYKKMWLMQQQLEDR